MKNSTVHIFLIGLALAFAIVGCGKRYVTKEALYAYIKAPSNGLIQTRNNDDISIEVSYKPHDLIISQEIEGNNLSDTQTDSIADKIKEMDYFTFKFSSDGKELVNKYAADPGVFNEVVTYLSAQIGKDIRLVHGQDTIPVLDFMYFPSYGAMSASEVLVVFKSSLLKKDGGLQILYNDEFFKTGLNQFEFEIQSFKSIPTLAPKKIAS